MYDELAGCPVASMTRTEKLVPDCATSGVPETTALFDVLGPSVIPEGSAPESMVQVNGAIPPKT